MSDNMDEQASHMNQQTQEEAESKPATVSEKETPQAEESTEKKAMNISFSIWPPTQRTRDAVTNRLIETLSTPSILSKRYGTFPHEEASETAKAIEEEAFNAAGSSSSGDDDDGVKILQDYSKQISKRMLDVVKSRSTTAAAAQADTKPSENDPSAAAAAEAETKPSENEPSAASPENES
ncbi:MFP1 attachment factor 1-like [Lycium barbarum]|uniref:MFP1 attachment factor 1-like n=1 Tax=Lycium barbarum TaxID=112863 RepID=UPI00293F0DA5|nr:MFP1 attachment factor 1-like [Lycium barbarum]